jgi:CelD/BcsL family acetyltransferase involved in cellulose biosynthesis
MTYAFERLDIRNHDWLAKIDSKEAGTIYQTPAWLAFLSRTQHGEPVVGALKEGRETIGCFTGLIVRKLGFRILGSPFPGWSTDYMGFALSARADRRQAVQALIDFAFHELECVHLEMMDRNLTESDLGGLVVQYRVYRGFEIDLTREEDELFSSMTSACRRCVRKAEREEVLVEEAHDQEFADEYYAQLTDVFAKQSLVPTYGIERVRQLITHVLPTGHLLLLRARDRAGRCIATGIFPHMNGVMYFWGGASWRHHQLSRPNEAIQWHVMKIGRQKGLGTYDMGGGGEYKRKYGGSEIALPWFRKSKYPWIRYLRDMAQQSHKLSQQSLGWFSGSHTREGPRGIGETSEI